PEERAERSRRNADREEQEDRAAERDQCGRQRDRERRRQPRSARHVIEPPEDHGRRRALRRDRRRDAREQGLRTRRKAPPNRLRQERDPADRRERQDGADRVDLPGIGDEERERGKTERLRRRDRPLEESGREEDADHDSRSNRGGVRAPDENEENDRDEQDGVAALSRDGRESESAENQSRSQRDVKAEDHQEMVKPTPTVAGNHPAVELRRAAEKKRGERAADVSIEPLSPGAGRRKGPVEEEVRDREQRERGSPGPTDLERALDRHSISRPRQRDVAGRRRKVFPLETPDERD